MSSHLKFNLCVAKDVPQWYSYCIDGNYCENVCINVFGVFEIAPFDVPCLNCKKHYKQDNHPIVSMCYHHPIAQVSASTSCTLVIWRFTRQNVRSSFF